MNHKAKTPIITLTPIPSDGSHLITVSTEWAKKWPRFFLSEIRQISTKFDNFWHTDSQHNRIT